MKVCTDVKDQGSSAWNVPAKDADRKHSDSWIRISGKNRVKGIMKMNAENQNTDTGLKPEKTGCSKDKSKPVMVIWTPSYQSYCSAGDEAECFCPVCESKVIEEDDSFCPACGQALQYHDEPGNCVTNGDMVRSMPDDELEKLFRKAVFCGSLKAYDCTSEECRGCSLPFCADIGQWLSAQMDHME